jgi:predicted amidophosphoribosyltransferase
VLAARAQLAQPAPAAPDSTLACPHCGHARQPADRFCARCGGALAVERV